MFQRIVHTVLVNRSRHIPGCTHHILGRISHSYPDPGMPKHLYVITSVAEGHTFVQTDMEIFQHLVNPDPFTASKWYDIRKKRIPPRGFTLGQDLHNAFFLFCSKKGD